MNAIHLKFNNGFEWVTSGNITFKGYMFDNNGNFLTASEAVELFHAINSIATLESILHQSDGVFSLIIDLPGGTLIATDPIGAFPLLYTKATGSWLISDDAGIIAARQNEWTYNREAQPEFLSAGFVLGDETLVKEIKRTQAGEILLLHHNEKKEQQTYYWFLPDYFTSKSKSLLKRELTDVLQNVTKRLVDSLQGRTAVVPLSGGYDSRLIVCMLKDAGYEQTVCFTYGRPNSESEISKKVAEALGFQWFFVDYNDIDIEGLTDNPEFIDYCNYVGNISSMPYLQEYFAVKHLKEQKLIPESSIFIPGHIGDNIAGSYVENTIRISKNRLRNNSRDIQKRYFNFLPLPAAQERMIETRLDKWFRNYDPPDYMADIHYDSTTEDWSLKERLSKFIFNSAGVFPFFGYQCRFPLFDSEFRKFFRRLPFSLRKHKALYDEVLSEEFFMPSGVHFPHDKINKRPLASRFKRIREKLRTIVPGAIMKHRLRKRDYICYHRFTAEMIRDLKTQGIKTPTRINSYNALICMWYSNKIKRNLTNKRVSS